MWTQTTQRQRRLENLPDPIVTTPRAALPVSLDAAKRQCKLAPSVTSWDDDLTDLINELADQIESDTQFVPLQQTYRWALPYLPTSNQPLRLPKQNVTQLTAVQYIDNGNQVVPILDKTDLILTDVWPVMVLKDMSATWPTDVNWDLYRPVTIDFLAGPATVDAVPAHIRRAILVTVERHFHDGGLADGGVADHDGPAWSSMINRLQAQFP